ncbi:MAG: NADH:flavin oxidoreductase, partial [Firmicutes bacterium]|nr:NADH:flavin oxidoreductase [Bacillota bacterium]
MLVAKPKRIGSMELKSGLIMLAMHTGYSDEGRITKRDIAFYEARAAHGAAAITHVAAVNDNAGLPGMHGLYSEEFLPGEKLLADMLHTYDCKLIVQLFHRGRNGGAGYHKPAVAPSSVPSPIYRETPKELTIEEINVIINEFASAADIAKRAGADAVEISCSAGYLLTLFLSPLTNLREDEYGGSEEKRLRFPLEVMRAVRSKVGKDYPVILRISGSQMIPGGYGLPLMQK